MPGFAVLVEVVGAVGAASACGAGVGEEGEAKGIAEGLDGDDVPEFFGDDVGGEDVDFVGRVGTLGAILLPGMGHEGVAVASGDLVAGGFDLDAPEAVAGVEDEVVAVAVSPGLGDAEAFEGGAF